MLFAIQQKYDFSSKSQPITSRCRKKLSCLQYSKSTIFQANHNTNLCRPCLLFVVCNTAKVRFFKQITTEYEQPYFYWCCLQYSKSTIFQANHNCFLNIFQCRIVVCNTAKVRFFKQITTYSLTSNPPFGLFAIQQKYDFSSKSQLHFLNAIIWNSCLQYSKSTIFQANHNQ